MYVSSVVCLCWIVLWLVHVVGVLSISRKHKNFVGCFGHNQQIRVIPSYQRASDDCLKKCGEKGVGVMVIGGMWCGCRKNGVYGVADADCAYTCWPIDKPECHCNDGYPSSLAYNFRARYESQQFIMNLKRARVQFRNCFLRRKISKTKPFDAMSDSHCKYMPMGMFNTSYTNDLDAKGCFGKWGNGVRLEHVTIEDAFQKCKTYCMDEYEYKYAAYANGVFCGCVTSPFPDYSSIGEITRQCRKGALCFDDRQGLCLCTNTKPPKTTNFYETPPIKPNIMTCYNRKFPTKWSAFSGSHKINLPGKSGDVCRDYCRIRGGSKFSAFYEKRVCRCLNTLNKIRHHNQSCSSACGRKRQYCGSAWSVAVYSVSNERTAKKTKAVSKAAIQRLMSSQSEPEDNDDDDDDDDGRGDKRKG